MLNKDLDQRAIDFCAGWRASQQAHTTHPEMKPWGSFAAYVFHGLEPDDDEIDRAYHSFVYATNELVRRFKGEED